MSLPEPRTVSRSRRRKTSGFGCQCTVFWRRIAPCRSAATTREPRGAIEVVQTGNRFAATCGNVGAFDLWLGVGTVDFAQPVVVEVNGAEVHRGPVTPDVAFLLERAAEDDDPTMLYGARLEVRVPAK